MHLLQVSMDGSIVTLSFLSELQSYRTEIGMSNLLSTGSCGFHASHGAFKAGVQSRDWTRQLDKMTTLM